MSNPNPGTLTWVTNLLSSAEVSILPVHPQHPMGFKAVITLDGKETLLAWRSAHLDMRYEGNQDEDGYGNKYAFPQETESIRMDEANMPWNHQVLFGFLTPAADSYVENFIDEASKKLTEYIENDGQ